MSTDGSDVNIELTGSNSNGSPAANTGAASSGIAWDAVVAEFVAMLLFVYIGCGAAAHVTFAKDPLLGGAQDPAWVLTVALAFGMAIMVLAYATGHVSGGQINCAVTLALCIAGELPWNQGFANFGGQMLGSVAGAALLLAGSSGAPGRDFTGGLGSNGVNPRYSDFNAFVNEAMMTFLLVYVIFETAVHNKSGAGRNAPLAIGFAVFLAHLVCIPVTGCSINPTRSFGPALVATMNGAENLWDDMWIFWVAPLLGATLAAMLRGKAISQANKED